MPYTKLERMPENWVGALSPIDFATAIERFGPGPYVARSEARAWVMARVKTGWPYSHQYT